MRTYSTKLLGKKKEKKKPYTKQTGGKTHKEGVVRERSHQLGSGWCLDIYSYWTNTKVIICYIYGIFLHQIFAMISK